MLTGELFMYFCRARRVCLGSVCRRQLTPTFSFWWCVDCAHTVKRVLGLWSYRINLAWIVQWSTHAAERLTLKAVECLEGFGWVWRCWSLCWCNKNTRCIRCSRWQHNKCNHIHTHAFNSYRVMGSWGPLELFASYVKVTSNLMFMAVGTVAPFQNLVSCLYREYFKTSYVLDVKTVEHLRIECVLVNVVYC